MSRWQIVDAAVTVAGVALFSIGVYMVIAAVGSFIPMSGVKIQAGVNIRMLVMAPLVTGMLLFLVGILTCALSDKIATMFRPDGDGS